MRRPDSFLGLATPSTWSLGQQYARGGRAHVVDFDSRTGQVLGRCRGSRGRNYTIRVSYDLDLDDQLCAIDGTCTCPVGFNCKHCVAVVLADLRDQGLDPGIGASPSLVPRDLPAAPPKPPAWSRTLDRIFSPSMAPGSGSAVRPLGLLVSFTPDRTVEQFRAALLGSRVPVRGFNQGGFVFGSPAGSVTVRPVRPGKTKKWVKSGISWWTVQGGDATVSPVQSAAVDALHKLYSGAAYLGGQDPLPLEGIDSQALWAVLERIRDVGVPLIEDDGRFSPVHLEETPALADIQISRDGAGDLTLSADLRHPQMPADSPTAKLGDPPHGIAWRDSTGLHLAGLDHAADRSWAQLAAEPRALRIPAEGYDHFITDVFPRIAQLDWASPDGSFTPPDPPAPGLHLELGVSGATATDPTPHAHLRWSWHYRDDRGRGRGPLALRAGRFDPGRDVDREEEILAPVLDALSGLPAVLSDADGPELRPESRLDGMDVITLVDEVRPGLEELGVVIEAEDLPQFRQVADPQVHVGLGADAGNDWLDLEITVEVDGHRLPISSLIRGLTLNDEAIFLEDGTYFTLDNPELDQLRQLLAEAAELGDQRRKGVQVPAVRISWWEELLSLGIVQTSQDQWFDAVRRAIAEPPEPAEVPDGLTADLRPYQLAGFRWMAGLRRSGLGGVLADDMGLGKTVQALAMILDEREHSEQEAVRPPWLVVAPTSVVSNWAEEAGKFTPGLRVAMIEATQRRRGTPLSEIAAGADVVVTSYALLRLESDDYAAQPWAGMLLDEAQNAKNRASKVFACIKTIGAPVVYAVTGTPMENNLDELWAVFALAAPGLLGGHKQFQTAFRRPIERDEDDAGQRMNTMRRRIAPFLLRRSKDQIALDLPAKQEQVLHVDLAPAHRRAYERQLQHERQRVLQLTEDIDHNQIEVLSALTRLRQLAIDPSLVDQGEEAKAPSSKLDALVPLLAQAAEEGHRVLVFSQFTRYLRRIAERLDHEHIAYSYLDGTTGHRRAVIDGFTKGDDPVFLISLKAGGVGINLTQADYAILADPWWNPAAENQAVDRAHRIGQTRPVHVYRMVARDTIEEKVLALQDAKRELISGVLDAGEGAAATGGSRLSAEDVRMLLS
ncbi:SNF2-related protein [Acidipropionibacterium virtanenii]|uniref:DEAD/DEAH box helicase n=1 Tax=Acidipropionibacterium virtanenii TaxID=2057246 RepID=UPI001FE471E8|nr:SNF2-related protein [Acidipropionibacterium virtanenii]